MKPNQGQMPEDAVAAIWAGLPADFGMTLDEVEVAVLRGLPALRKQFAEELAGEFERRSAEIDKRAAELTDAELGALGAYDSAANLTRKWATRDRGRS